MQEQWEGRVGQVLLVLLVGLLYLQPPGLMVRQRFQETLIHSLKAVRVVLVLEGDLMLVGKAGAVDRHRAAQLFQPPILLAGLVY